MRVVAAFLHFVFRTEDVAGLELEFEFLAKQRDTPATKSTSMPGCSKMSADLDGPRCVTRDRTRRKFKKVCCDSLSVFPEAEFH